MLDDRMAAALKFRDDTDGRECIVDLTLDDVGALLADLVTLLKADQQQVSRWWTVLADGRDGRPRAAKVNRRRT